MLAFLSVFWTSNHVECRVAPLEPETKQLHQV
jgi:hypothetical protein